MAGLTTHVLDNMAGVPAAGLVIELWYQDADQWRQLKTATTNNDGRVDDPILSPSELTAGTYELRFHAGDYL